MQKFHIRYDNIGQQYAERVVSEYRKLSFEIYDSLPRDLRFALMNANDAYSMLEVANFLRLNMKDRQKRIACFNPEMQNILKPWLKKVL